MRTLRSRRHRLMVWHAQFGLCRYCRAPIQLETMHVDHVVPYAKGGATRIANLVASCPSCNLKKGTKDVSALCY